MGLFDTKVTLRDGRERLRDDAYLRDAILEPDKEVIRGFGPSMPEYRDRLSSSDVDDLLAYLKSLERR